MISKPTDQTPKIFYFFISFLLLSSSLFSQGFEGYYRFPDVHNNTIVFSAEGDIWTVPLSGGLASRLTTHLEEETFPSISPDGKTILFSASYEGPTEIYTIPINGGVTTRWTYEREASVANTWTPNGNIVYSTWAYNKKPDNQLVKIDTQLKTKSFIPLDQASEASFNKNGKTIYFVRPADHGNVTKRYKGGTARQIWKFTEGDEEAIKLTTDHLGESHHPMWYNDKVYFISDRDGIMNIWSMNDDGSDLIQHTKHNIFDVRYANVSNGNLVYQLGADLWKYNIESKSSSKIDIKLVSDHEQLMENWDENPSKYITNINVNKDGSKIVITARGKVFVAPVKSGRIVSFSDNSNVRYRDATFSADGEKIITLSDESGEFEFISLPANGIGNSKSITKNGEILRYEGVPSPDGKWITYSDLNQEMHILNIETGKSSKISTNNEGINGYTWSPDSKWISFVQAAENTMLQIKIYNVDSKKSFDLTTDRANSMSPSWSPDGKFLYFISDRSFTTIVGSPWGTRQPEPYFDASEKIYHVALQKGTRSPFRPNDELYKKEECKDCDTKEITVLIDEEGIQQRIEAVPIKPGNYRNLAVNKSALYVLSSDTGLNSKTHLAVIKITNEDIDIKPILNDIKGYQLTADGKKIFISKETSFYITEAGTDKITVNNKNSINLSGWKFPITPKEDWKQIFTDAWRMERDYFYDKNMHGVDWDAMYTRYFPLVNRVTTRNELSDLIGRFVGELSALHTSVRGGDQRSDSKNILVANLGAVLLRDEAKTGFVIDYIYKVDPDYPDEKSPLDDPYLDVKKGDVITHVNGKDVLSAIDIGELIRNQVGKQVRLSIKRDKVSKDIIVTPIGNSFNLRYRDWEYGNRKYVEKKSKNSMGYLHLRAMGSNDINQFYREFYPIFNRQGLIIDVRYNWGGNIDSFILEKLLRKAWMYWKGRSGKQYWNMPYAFRGHIVILVNENTYSDGEAFADGFKELGLGVSIGTRTWGGEIWLTSENSLSDNGLARAPMFGVYGDGKWRIEGHGFEPDIVIDNLPHQTFNGIDAQLDKAIELLTKLIEEDPRTVPPVPKYPNKSFKNNKK
ncbi:MAG: S41 family peptidase [Polaribacter sp.]|uniref:S41 family peptidase n=1 Tax=Polaribacter sp. TaxID=1920175 RepID=UPI003BB186DE